MKTKSIVIGGIVLVAAGTGLYLYVRNSKNNPSTPLDAETAKAIAVANRQPLTLSSGVKTTPTINNEAVAAKAVKDQIKVQQPIQPAVQNNPGLKIIEPTTAQKVAVLKDAPVLVTEIMQTPIVSTSVQNVKTIYPTTSPVLTKGIVSKDYYGATLMGSMFN